MLTSSTLSRSQCKMGPIHILLIILILLWEGAMIIDAFRDVWIRVRPSGMFLESPAPAPQEKGEVDETHPFRLPAAPEKNLATPPKKEDWPVC